MKTEVQRIAREETCKGAREKICEALMFKARELAAYYDDGIKAGEIKLPSDGVKLVVRVELQSIHYPERVRGSELIGGQEIMFSRRDVSIPDPGMVTMLDTNERRHEAKLIADILGTCMLCGQRPKYSKKGHRKFKGPTVMHSCPDLPGSPIVIFTIPDWVNGTDPYDPSSGGRYRIGRAEGFDEL